MTVMHSSSDVADKSVSTEDATDMIHLDAMLTALVESKVEAMKAASAIVLTAPSADGSGSALISPGHSGSTPLSTMSSSRNRYRHDKHQQHYNRKHHCINEDQHQRHRKKRHDSAPGENFIGELYDHPQKNCRRIRRASEMTHNRKCKRRYSRDSQISPDDMYVDLNTPMELSGLGHHIAFMNIERPMKVMSDNEEYPGLHRSACLSQSAGNLQIAKDDNDYIALNIEDELEMDSLDCSDLSMDDSPDGIYRLPRRKRKRKRKRAPHSAMMTRMPEVMLVDHNELPPRARWTIVATACLLLAMSILLVGVTLRMAPIIDDMVRKENEALLNSLNQDTTEPMTNTSAPI